MKKFLSLLAVCILACSVSFGSAGCDLFSARPDGDDSGDTPPIVTPPDSETGGGPDDERDPDEGKEPEEEEPVEVIKVQQIDAAESTATIYNPDQGFYVPVGVKVTDNGVSYNSSTITGATRLFHLRMDISAFSANGGGTDHPLTQAALDGIGNLLSSLRARDKNAIVRFCYDAGFAGHADCEPSLQVMLGHAEQFCAVLNGYESTITALEVGMVGPWGEMHTSAAATPANISALIGAFLANTTALPISVRTPKMIYHYLGIEDGAPAGYQVPESAYRLGMFNDGYLGSENDLGTYTDRAKDVAFIGGQTAHLPYGGEVVVPESTMHDIEVCLPEMYQIHLSYLNIQWNNTVVDKWKATTVTAECAGADELYYGKSAFDYIQNHMGYRFVLKSSTFRYTEKLDNLKIAIELENVGFGNLNKTKKTKILFVDKNDEIVSEKTAENFRGENNALYSVPLELPKGEYRVYLRLYGDELQGTPLYCIQFANNNIYDAVLRANLVGKIEIA